MIVLCCDSLLDLAQMKFDKIALLAAGLLGARVAATVAAAVAAVAAI